MIRIRSRYIWSTALLSIATAFSRIATASPPDGTWRGLGVQPDERYGLACVYDEGLDRLVVHGGVVPTPLGLISVATDSWGFSLSDPQVWRPIASGGPPRFGAAHVYDPIRNQLVVFGGSVGPGEGEPSAHRNDSFVLSLSGSPTWTQLTPMGIVPSVRYGHSGVHDPLRDRMVIFGGNGGGGALRNDVRALDLANPAWSFVTLGGTPPTPRYQHAAIYDPARDRMVIFGGQDATGPLNEVWVADFAASTWTLLATTGTPPTPRFGATAIYDPAGDRMVFFGGQAASGPSSEAWSLSMSDASWTLLATPNPPAPRHLHGAAYDSRRERMLVFGGYTDYDDVWALSLTGVPAWTQLHAGIEPAGRYFHTAIHLPASDQMLVFGGITNFVDGNNSWMLDLGPLRWSPFAEPREPGDPMPAARHGHSAIYDPSRDEMIVFGGQEGLGGALLGDLWRLTLHHPVGWSPMVALGAPPPPRVGHSAIYDPPRDRMIVFGGGDNRTFELTLSGTPTWTELPGSGPPGARSFHAAVYDPPRDRMIVIGGTLGIPDVWELTLAGTPTWATIATSGAPPGQPVWSWGAIYDPVRDRLVLHGAGYDIFPQPETFALSLDGPHTWTQLQPDGSVPSSRGQGTVIADAARDRMVLYGGQYHGGTDTHFAYEGASELSWAVTLSVPSPESRGRGGISSIRPNPAIGVQSIEFDLAGGSNAARLEVFSATGQRVWSKSLAGLTSGKHVVEWDGRRTDGSKARPGVYWARIHGVGEAGSARFVRVN